MLSMEWWVVVLQGRFGGLEHVELFAPDVETAIRKARVLVPQSRAVHAHLSDVDTHGAFVPIQSPVHEEPWRLSASCEAGLYESVQRW